MLKGERSKAVFPDTLSRLPSCLPACLSLSPLSLYACAHASLRDPSNLTPGFESDALQPVHGVEAVSGFGQERGRR